MRGYVVGLAAVAVQLAALADPAAGLDLRRQLCRETRGQLGGGNA
jgi:hypothetical protein